MALQDNWPIWGNDGSQPNDGQEYQESTSPEAFEFNYLWAQIRDTFASIESRLSSVESDTSSNTSDISSLQSNKLDSSTYSPESDTHSRYADNEAVSAVDNEVTDAASSVSDLDTAVYNNDNDISTLQSQAHSEYHGAEQHDTDKLHNDAVGFPTYASESDVPSIAEGEMVLIEQSDGSYGIYVENGQ